MEKSPVLFIRPSQLNVAPGDRIYLGTEAGVDGKLPRVAMWLPLGWVLLLGPGSGGPGSGSDRLGSSVRRLVRAGAGRGGMAWPLLEAQSRTTCIELAHWQRLLITMTIMKKIKRKNIS